MAEFKSRLLVLFRRKDQHGVSLLVLGGPHCWFLCSHQAASAALSLSSFLCSFPYSSDKWGWNCAWQHLMKYSALFDSRTTDTYQSLEQLMFIPHTWFTSSTWNRRICASGSGHSLCKSISLLACLFFSTLHGSSFFHVLGHVAGAMIAASSLYD